MESDWRIFFIKLTEYWYEYKESILTSNPTFEGFMDFLLKKDSQGNL